MVVAEDKRNEPLLVSTSRSRQLLDIGNTKVWELIAAGELETVSIGRKRLVTYSSLRAYVERLRAQATKAA